MRLLHNIFGCGSLILGSIAFQLALKRKGERRKRKKGKEKEMKSNDGIELCIPFLIRRPVLFLGNTFGAIPFYVCAISSKVAWLRYASYPVA